MARPQESTTFNVPNSTPSVTSSASKKGSRDAKKPFVIVPEGMVVAEDKLEPHWLDAIDSATD
jgi:hypothetical protein